MTTENADRGIWPLGSFTSEEKHIKGFRPLVQGQQPFAMKFGDVEGGE
jgi:hypothetical protein